MLLKLNKGKNKIDEETNEHSNPDFNKQNIETLL
jgi:hypothetical protein